MDERIKNLKCVDRRVKKDLHRMARVPKLDYMVEDIVSRYEARDYKALKREQRGR